MYNYFVSVSNFIHFFSAYSALLKCSVPTMDTTNSLKMTPVASQSVFSHVEEENLPALRAFLDKNRDVDNRSDVSKATVVFYRTHTFFLLDFFQMSHFMSTFNHRTDTVQLLSAACTLLNYCLCVHLECWWSSRWLSADWDKFDLFWTERFRTRYKS